MTRIRIALGEPTFKSLLIYYWHQFPTHEYAVVFVGLFLLQMLAEVFVLILGIRFAACRPAYVFTNMVLTMAFCISGGLAGYTLLRADVPPSLLYWIGLGIFLCAYIGREITHSVLKPQYSSYLEMALNERMVISGIFALIRYPLAALYLAEMSAFLLIAWNPISVIMLAIACLSILWKIRSEEQRLTIQFGECFTAYRRTTKRIIPFVY